jgi:hypothetical protein
MSPFHVPKARAAPPPGDVRRCCSLQPRTPHPKRPAAEPLGSLLALIPDGTSTGDIHLIRLEFLDGCATRLRTEKATSTYFSALMGEFNSEAERHQMLAVECSNCLFVRSFRIFINYD